MCPQSLVSWTFWEGWAGGEEVYGQTTVYTQLVASPALHYPLGLDEDKTPSAWVSLGKQGEL